MQKEIHIDWLIFGA